MRKIFQIFLIGLILFSACSKEDEDTVDLGYDYCPVESGNFIRYHVVQTTYDDFTDSTLVEEFGLLEVVDTGYEDLEGRSIHNLNRFMKDLSDSVPEWKLVDVWTIYKGRERLERMEENVTFVKLSFPLRRGKTWDGNARNDSLEQEYTVLDYDLKNALDSATFKKTCRVNHFKNANLIEDQLVEEIYARDVGLVQRIERDVKLDPTDDSKSGYEIKWIYVEHGAL